MTTRTAHTPGPWDRQNKGDLYGPSARLEIVAGTHNGYATKNLPTIAKMKGLREVDYANAEFIVRAVNCYDALLEALKLIERWTGNELIASRGTRVERWAHERAQAAIAQAEEHDHL